MSVCSPCQVVDEVPVCVTSLVVGTISSLATAVHIYIKDITTGKIVRFEETSSVAGLVTITNLDQEPDFMPNHAYELWITLATAVSIEEKEDITVAGLLTTVDCIALSFVYTGEDYTTITLTV